MKEKLLNHPILYSLAASEVIVVIILAIMLMGKWELWLDSIESIIEFIMSLFISLFFGLFLIYPFAITILNLVFLFERHKSEKSISAGIKMEVITLILGFSYSAFFLSLVEVCFHADWTEQLANAELHTPIATWTLPTIITIALIAVCGYAALRLVPLEKLPPFITVCAIGCMYLGVALSVFCIIQFFATKAFIVCLFPLNCIIITAKIIRELIIKWNESQLTQDAKAKYSDKKLLHRCNRMLCKAERWPLAGFLIMWPIFGILTVILVLFGQEPDSIIKAWTETSDWNLSQRISPQHIYYDEHYLCTVAAGGHKKVVKPLRVGVRHGHQVIVNRQLCVANAFEQIIEERTPKLHSKLRHFYDKYGYPIARHIHSPFTADAIYLIMKPLEWLFLIFIYLCDSKPENRIAVQYLPKR